VTERVLPTATAREARHRIAQVLRDRAGRAVAVMLLTGAATAAALAGPALIGSVVDLATNADRSGGGGRIDRIALAYAAVVVVGAVLRYAAGVCAATLGEAALAELRTEVFDHALAVPIDVMERAGTGDLISRVTGDVNVLAQAVRTTVPSFTFAAVEAALTVVALALVDVRLAAVALLAGFPAAYLGGRWYVRHAPVRYQRERERHADLAGSLLEAYRGGRTLTAHRAGARWRHGLAGRGRATVDSELGTTSARNRLRPAVSASLAASLVAVVAVGAALAHGGTVSVGGVSAAALYVIRLFDPVGILLEEIDQVQQSTASVARLVGVTQLPTAATIGPSPRPSQGRAERARGIPVALVDVCFGYAPGVPVLDRVHLAVDAGERIVVVGTSGAGKSTLVKLLCGTHRAGQGAVLLDGRPIETIEEAALPRLVAMVAQEGHVFVRSVAENVRLGRAGADDETVRAALDAVDALGWADALPHGLDTVVGTGHHLLSPPQAQQLGLARLVCADPAVVLLDEATADLDPTAAARTERHLDAALAGRTVITIAHRLDAAARADRVVVLEAGTVVAEGRHDELLAAGGAYAELWAHWQADRGLDPSVPPS
jgi:ABC-type multidrug transport system fused ATPase/permease subunit